MLPDILETARLQLRPFRLQDVDDVLIYATDPEWARYLPVPQPYTPAEGACASTLAIPVRQRDPRVIGATGCTPQRNPGRHRCSEACSIPIRFTDFRALSCI